MSWLHFPAAPLTTCPAPIITRLFAVFDKFRNCDRATVHSWWLSVERFTAVPMNPSLLVHHCSVSSELWSSRVLFCMDWSLCDGCTRLSWSSGFSLHWQVSTFHLASGQLPRAARKVLRMVIDCLPPHPQKYHLHDYYTTRVRQAERQSSVDVLRSWVHAKWQDVEAALPTERDECTELPAFFFLCWTYLLESRVTMSIYKPFSCLNLCQQLVLIQQTVSLYLWSLISSERSGTIFIVIHGYLVPFSGSNTG